MLAMCQALCEILCVNCMIESSQYVHENGIIRVITCPMRKMKHRKF